MNKIIAIVVFGAVLVLVSTLFEQEPKYDIVGAEETGAVSDRLARDLETFSAAMNNRDFETVISMTHPKIVESLGGHSAAVQKTQTLLAEVVKNVLGMTFETNNHITEINDTLAAVVTYKIQMKKGEQRFDLESFYLVLSEDQGKKWYFIDGAGFQKLNDAKQDKLLQFLMPGYADELSLPEKKLPVRTQ